MTKRTFTGYLNGKGSTTAPTRAPLSESEMRVLRAAAEGKTVADTALERHRGIETVKAQRRRILYKLEARNMTQAVAIGYEHGLLGTRRAEEDVTGGQKAAFKAKRDDLARLREADKHQVEQEALAEASLRLGREVESISDHNRSEASDTLDWLESEIVMAKAASVVAAHRSGE